MAESDVFRRQILHLKSVPALKRSIVPTKARANFVGHGTSFLAGAPKMAGGTAKMCLDGIYII